MRAFLVILSMPTGAAAIMLLLVAFTSGGTDFHFVGAGVFLTAFVLALGLVGVMARLEEIRDRKL